jgi:type II secretory pathway component PulF
MSLSSAPPEKTFRFRGVATNGEIVSDVVKAANLRDATRLIAAKGMTPVECREVRTAVASRRRSRRLNFSERVAVMRQLALMVDAGVPLLESVETVASGLESAPAQAEFEAIGGALRGGDTLSHAFATHATGFPAYVYAMTQAGEATGRLGDVLRDASEQMSYEDRMRRDVLNALTYPGFLSVSGLAAVLFIFSQVVPRFATMVGDRRSTLPWVSRMILNIGEFANANLLLIVAGGVGLAFLGALAFNNSRVRQGVYEVSRRMPLVGDLLIAREVASWSRLMGFAMASGVVLLEASALARETVPAGRFRSGLEQVERDLRSGVPIDRALADNTSLSSMDVSMLKAGDKSGSLAKMFSFVADSYENRLRDNLKRVTALVEPIAIGMVSIVVGGVALSLVLTLSSLYDTVF